MADGSEAGSASSGTDGYGTEEVSRLEFIWGEGFMSPGGRAEVARTLGGADLAGMRVLDIGCGIGGADLALVREHGAELVTGVDVQQELLEIASARAAKAGLADHIVYERIDAGPLPFPAGSFDTVFSKDAIIHVHDKPGIYAEAFRVLRHGGLLRVSDWLRGPGDEHTVKVAELVGEAGHDFAMWSLAEIGQIAAAAGFVDVELEDRNSWYTTEARRELDTLTGPSRQEFANRFGEEATTTEIGFWQLLVECLEQGALRPGHIRALRP